MTYGLIALSSAEKWSTGGMTAFIGLGMTFVMLALLIGSIVLLRLILKGLDKAIPNVKNRFSALFAKKKKPTDTNTNSADVLTECHTDEPDAETMKVIESAVKTYVAGTATDGKPHDRIRILSVKEVSNE